MYTIYIIELSKRAFRENKQFREANPQYNGVSECLYVGMTSTTPKKRWKQHKKLISSKKGYMLSANIVYKYGLYLRPSLYREISKIKTKTQAIRLEKDITLKYRRAGYAVWSN